MGSDEFQGLPKTPPFRRVVGQLGVGAGFAGLAGIAPGTVDAIADATLDASLNGLERAKGDEGLNYVFYLLTQLTQAARQPDFLASLNRLGLPPPKVVQTIPASDSGADEYDISDLVASYTTAVDRHLRQTRSRTDIGELAQRAAAESLTILCSPYLKAYLGIRLKPSRTPFMHCPPRRVLRR